MTPFQIHAYSCPTQSLPITRMATLIALLGVTTLQGCDNKNDFSGFLPDGSAAAGSDAAFGEAGAADARGLPGTPPGPGTSLPGSPSDGGVPVTVPPLSPPGPAADAGVTNPNPVPPLPMPDAGVPPTPPTVDAGVTPPPPTVDAGVTPPPPAVDAGVMPPPPVGPPPPPPGMCAPFAVCGGDIVGTWDFTAYCDIGKYPAPPTCPQQTINRKGLTKTASFVFEPNGRYKEEGLIHGSVESTLPLSCVPQITSCTQLGMALFQQLSREYSDVACVGADVCTCKLTLRSRTINNTGSYRLIANRILLDGVDQGEYCVSGRSLAIMSLPMNGVTTQSQLLRR